MEEREETYINPCGLTEVLPGLWLGGSPSESDIKSLYKYKIKFILTVNTFPLPIEIYDTKNFTIKFIQADDTTSEDLLSHFDEAFEFIENALQKGSVLVHCFFGISRSSTVVISYIMKKNNWLMEEAYQFVKSKRQCISPNAAFMAQLMLFQNMGNKLNESNLNYKLLKLYKFAEHVRRLKNIPDSVGNLIKTVDTHKTCNLTVFRCNKCRTKLGTSLNVMPHEENKKNITWEDYTSTNLSTHRLCEKLIFIEPLSWMQNIYHSVGGKLFCPKESCKQKVGSFSWTIGCVCPCGVSICPGFYLIPSKTDKIFKI